MPESLSPQDREEISAYEPEASLSGTVVTSLKWKLSTQVVREGTRLGVAVLLARMLTPEQWGLATMALAVVVFVELIPNNMTVGLIQRTQIDELDRSTILWTVLALGLVLTVLGVAASGLVADLYGEPDVQGLFAAASVGFAISASTSVPESLLMRDLAYRALEIRQMASVLVGGATAVVLALAGAGPWAIIGNSLAALATAAVLLWWFVRWRPRLVFSATRLADLGRDGLRVMGTQLLTLAQLYVDKVLVGRQLGAAASGTYAFAYQLMFTPIGNIANPVQHLLFPVFATIQEDKARLDAAWLRAKRLSVALMTPTFLTLFVVGPDLIPTVFGTRWVASVPVLQLLCIAGVPYSLGTQNWSLLVVRDRAGTLLALTLFTSAVVVTSVFIGVPLGVEGVAAMLAIAYWLLALPDLFVTARAGSVSFVAAARATYTPLPFAAGATVVALIVRWGFVEVDVPALVRLVVVPLILALVYMMTAYVGSAALREEAKSATRWIRARRST